LEKSDIGNRNRKNTMLSKIFGIMYPMNCDSFIHPHSIFLLKNEDIIPTTPTMSDTMTAHCQENTKYRIKNPVEIIKIVDFDVSVFMLFPSMFKIEYK